MTKKAVVIALIIALAFAGVQAFAQTSVPIAQRGYANPNSLISAEALESIMDRDNVKVVDFRPLTGFATGHIPGAIRIDRNDLADADAEFNIMAASPEQVAAVLADSGIRPSDTVVVYCDNGLWASRIWWLLSMYGHEDVRILDGGLNRWKDLGMNTRIIGRRTGTATYTFANPGTATLATVADVQAALSSDTVILDTRSMAEFVGERSGGGSGADGRIPGAVHVEWTNALNEDGTFRTAAELTALYAAAGIDGSVPVITYCQGGVRAAHSMFVLQELLGFSNVSNFDGSWLVWSNTPGAPIVTGN